MLPKGSFQKPMNYNNNDNFIRINICLVFSPKLNTDKKKRKEIEAICLERLKAVIWTIVRYIEYTLIIIILLY